MIIAVIITCLGLITNCGSIVIEVVLPHAVDKVTTFTSADPVKDVRIGRISLDIDKLYISPMVVGRRKVTHHPRGLAGTAESGIPSTLEVSLPQAHPDEDVAVPNIGMISSPDVQERGLNSPVLDGHQEETLSPEPRNERRNNRFVKDITEKPAKLFLIAELPSMKKKPDIQPDLSKRQNIPASGGYPQENPLLNSRILYHDVRSDQLVPKAEWVNGNREDTDILIPNTTNEIPIKNLLESDRMKKKGSLIRVKETYFNDFKEVDHLPDQSVNQSENSFERKPFEVRETDAEDPRVVNFEKERTEVKNLKLTDVKMGPQAKRDVDSVANWAKIKSGPANTLTIIGILLLLMMLVLIIFFGVWMYGVSSNRKSENESSSYQVGSDEVVIDIETLSSSQGGKDDRTDVSGTSVSSDSDSSPNPKGSPQEPEESSSKVATTESTEFETVIQEIVGPGQDSLDVASSQSPNADDDFAIFEQPTESTETEISSTKSSSCSSSKFKDYPLSNPKFPKKCRRITGTSESQWGKADDEKDETEVEDSVDLRTFIREVNLKTEGSPPVAPSDSASSLFNFISSKWASEDEDDEEDAERQLDDDHQALVDAVTMASFLKFDDESNPPSEIFEVCRNWMEDEQDYQPRMQLPKHVRVVTN